MSAIPEEMLAELRRLQKLSSKVGGLTPLGHENRLAGDLLATLALDAMAEYDVTTNGLSSQMGLSPQTMRFFLMRRGAIKTPPGMARHIKGYSNTHTLATGGGRKPRRDSCGRGHDTSTPDSRYSDGNCKECKRERERRSYAKKKAA